MLIVELATFSSGVSAFTIRRSENPADLAAEETANLQVRNDLSRNNVKVIDIKNDVTSHKLPIETTAKTEEIQKNSGKNEEVQPSTVNVFSTQKLEETTEDKTTTSGTSTMKGSGKKYDVALHKLPIETTAITEAIQKERGNSKIVHYSTDNISSTDIYTEETSEGKTTMESTSMIPKDITSYSTDEVEEFTSEEASTSTDINNLNENNNRTLLNDNINIDDNISTTTDNVAVVMVSLNVRSIIPETATYDLNSSSEVVTNTQPSTKISSYSTEPSEANESTKEDADEKATSLDQITYPTSYSEINSPLTEKNESTTMISKLEDTTEIKKDKGTFTEVVDNGNDSGTVIPYWKKYTTIERKRLTTEGNSEIPTKKDEDMAILETGQTTLSFHKAFSVPSDIPSLENLKNELLSLNMKLSTRVPDVLSSPITVATVIPLTSESDGISTTETKSEATKIDVVSSMRAGFLDHSSRPTTTERDITTIQKELTTNVPTETEKIETEREDPAIRKEEKKISRSSQSQLVSL